MKLAEKLEQKNISPTSDSATLRAALVSIIDEEEALPAEARDYDLIDEAIQSVLTLDGMDTERLRENAERIASAYSAAIREERTPARQKHGRYRLLIPIAAIISLMLAGAMLAYALGFDLTSMPKNAYLKLKECIAIDIGGSTVMKTTNRTDYSSYDEFLKAETELDIPVLDPIPEGMAVEEIVVADFGDSICVLIDVKTSDGEKITITFETSVTIDMSKRDLERIGNYDVGFSVYEGKPQFDFAHNDTYCIVQSVTRELISTVVENLK